MYAHSKVQVSYQGKDLETHQGMGKFWDGKVKTLNLTNGKSVHSWNLPKYHSVSRALLIADQVRGSAYIAQSKPNKSMEFWFSGNG